MNLIHGFNTRLIIPVSEIQVYMVF